MKEEIKNLVNISRKIGSYPEFVQGGGGNTSVKIDDNLMVIKASGYLLKDMTKSDGFAFVNYNDINDHIKNDGISSNTEDGFSNFIKENIGDNEFDKKYILNKNLIDFYFNKSDICDNFDICCFNGFSNLFFKNNGIAYISNNDLNHLYNV